MEDKINVLITSELADELLERISDAFPQADIMYNPTRNVEDITNQVEDIHVLYTGNTLPPPEQAPALEWVHVNWAGVDHILDHPLFTDTDIQFTNVSGIHAVNMGEYVMSLVLAFAHRVPAMLEDTRAGRWPEGRAARYLPDELRGATIGILGYGAIGREVARLADAFGMRVLATKRELRDLSDHAYAVEGTGDPEGEIPYRFYPPEATNTLLAECDYVVLLVPLVEATEHLIDAESFAAMKETAYLINVARGGVVDEKALIEALQTSQIAGAGLDVFQEEPLPEDSPLWELDNVILSPHVAGMTPHYNDRAVDLFIENMRHFLAGETLINQIDRELGY